MKTSKVRIHADRHTDSDVDIHRLVHALLLLARERAESQATLSKPNTAVPPPRSAEPRS